MKDTHDVTEWVNIVIDIVEGLVATDKTAVVASWVSIEIGSLLNITIAKINLKLKIWMPIETQHAVNCLFVNGEEWGTRYMWWRVLNTIGISLDSGPSDATEFDLSGPFT